MKRIFLSVLLVALAFSLMAFQSAGLAQDNPCTSLVMGGSCVLQSDETLPSGMVIMGGSAELEDGSTVEGDVVVMGGNLTANGVIEGDLNVIGGNATLGSRSRVEGDVNTAGGNLDRRDGAEIEGSYNSNVPVPFPFQVPGRVEVPSWDNGPSDWSSPLASGVNMIWSLFWWLARSLLWAVLALILVLMAPRHVQRVANEVTTRPVESGGLGCLTALIVPLVLAVLAITICLLPITIVGGVLLVVAWSIGIIALGYELGKRLVAMLKQDWAPAVEAALGTGLLTLALNGISWVPCVGWIVPAVVGSVGLGAVLLTRFGSQTPAGSILGGSTLSSPAASSYGAYGAQIYDAPVSPATQVSDDIPPTSGIYDDDGSIDTQHNDPTM